MIDEKEAQRRLEWAVRRMPAMEGVAVKVPGEVSEARLFRAEFTKAERTVTAKVPRSLIEAVDAERGILPLGLSDYLRGILLMFGNHLGEDSGRNITR